MKKIYTALFLLAGLSCAGLPKPAGASGIAYMPPIVMVDDLLATIGRGGIVVFQMWLEDLYGKTKDYEKRLKELSTSVEEELSKIEIEEIETPSLHDIGLSAREDGLVSGDSTQLAQQMQEQIISDAGTQADMAHMNEVSYYQQQEAGADALARVLVLKTELAELKKVIDELDGAEGESATDAADDDAEKDCGDSNYNQELRDNAAARLAHDGLLTLKQQVVATRLKIKAEAAIKRLDQIPEELSQAE